MSHFQQFKIQGRALVVWLLASLLLSACSTITVLNDTNKELRVVLRAPDSQGMKVSRLGSSTIKTVVSVIGGNFFIAVLPDQALIDNLTIEKTKLQASLISIDLTQEEANNIRTQIFEIRQKIDAAEVEAKKSSAVCAGFVLEFGSVSATVYTDKTTGKVALACTVNAPEINSSGE
jgi:hypothetical protein